MKDIEQSIINVVLESQGLKLSDLISRVVSHETPNIDVPDLIFNMIESGKLVEGI